MGSIHAADESVSVLLQDGLVPETIEIAEQMFGRDEVIKCLCKKLASHLTIEEAALERAVFDRERARSTAFPNGAAIPHCRIPGLSKFGIALMVLRKAVKWDENGREVDLALLIAGPAESVSDHLRVLANSSQLLDSPALRRKLRRAPDADSAYKLVIAAEGAIEKRRSQDGALRELRSDQSDQAGADHLAEIADKFDW